MSTPIKVIDGQGLIAQERQLISNFRAAAACAKTMLVDLSVQYKRALPATPVALTLVGTDRAPNQQHETY